jgi:hypothetical protein
MPCGCGGKRIPHDAATAPRKPGIVPSAETFAASAQPRYLVVARQTSTDGKRFSTLTAAQDYARRSGGIIRQL